jgi:hypothetical protein
MGYVSVSRLLSEGWFVDYLDIRTELSLGVIAPNLGLSRSMYRQFVKRDQESAKTHHSQQGGYNCESRSRSGYSRYQGSNQQAAQGRRGSSLARSEDSEIPLRPIIEKTTEIHIH